ncbi:MAG TPA: hypothetical protein VIZ43_30090 [Trebonia sp.]
MCVAGAEACVAGAEACVAGADACVAGADDGARLGEVVAGGRVGVDVCGEPDALGWAVGDVLAPPVLGDEAPPPPVGDGVRPPGADELWLLVGGDGVKIFGTDEPPPVHAATVTPSSTAPAAERPAVSHAP